MLEIAENYKLKEIKQGYELKYGNVILPKHLYSLQPCSSTVQTNIFFKNVTEGLVPEELVQVECNYGRPYGRFWQLEDGDSTKSYNCCNETEFPLTIAVMDENYRVKNAQKTIIHRVPVKNTQECNVLFLGDSITRGNMYVTHIQKILPNLRSVGIRSYDGGYTNVEGRGGWSFETYFSADRGSPFLFPVGVPAEKYYGDVRYWEKVVTSASMEYDYHGFQNIAQQLGISASGYPAIPKEKDVVYDSQQDLLLQWTNGCWEKMDKKPMWEFSFASYIKRYHPHLKQLHMVSILMGANDLQSCDDIAGYIANMKKVIASIHEYDPNIKIIVNLPTQGTTADGQGANSGCRKPLEYFRRLMQLGAKAILSEWDNQESMKRNIYVGGMMAALDPIDGFERIEKRVNPYRESAFLCPSNDVHPDYAGHCQMGDALGALIQFLRNNMQQI